MESLCPPFDGAVDGEVPTVLMLGYL
jgi:hypothetical protein